MSNRKRNKLFGGFNALSIANVPINLNYTSPNGFLPREHASMVNWEPVNNISNISGQIPQAILDPDTDPFSDTDDFDWLKFWENEFQNTVKFQNEIIEFPEFLSNARDFVVNGLNANERDALEDYTGFVYLPLNAGLREYYRTGKSSNINPRIISIISGIDDAFRKAPKLTKSIKVYRGMDQFSHDFDMSSPFLSTSLSERVAKKFTDKNGYILEIDVAIGTPVLPLSELSLFKSENEILLPRKGKIKYISHSIRDDGIQIIKLEFSQPSISWIDSLLFAPEDTETERKIFESHGFDDFPIEFNITTWDTVLFLLQIGFAYKYGRKLRGRIENLF
jgi:hypothetical protein